LRLAGTGRSFHGSVLSVGDVDQRTELEESASMTRHGTLLSISGRSISYSSANGELAVEPLPARSDCTIELSGNDASVVSRSLYIAIRADGKTPMAT
jgi:hypothetical protein